MSPLFGQVQFAVDESLTPTGGIGQEHPDLAVLRLAGGAGVLTLDPDALVSLLDEARLIDDQDTPILVAQMLENVFPQVVSERMGIPVGSTQQVLDTIGRHVSRHFGQLPRVLALSPREQTAQIVVRPLA